MDWRQLELDCARIGSYGHIRGARRKWQRANWNIILNPMIDVIDSAWPGECQIKLYWSWFNLRQLSVLSLLDARRGKLPDSWMNVEETRACVSKRTCAVNFRDFGTIDTNIDSIQFAFLCATRALHQIAPHFSQIWNWNCWPTLIRTRFPCCH